MRHLIGIEIGGTKLQLVVGDELGRILERRKLTVEPSRGAQGIREQIQRELPGLARLAQNLSGIGVGFGGPVNWRTGQICRSHQIEGWSEFQLGPWIQEMTGKPVVVDNDANVAALGEASLGAGSGFATVFYVTLGSGVGGGLVCDGRIYHGASPGEAEIGHVRLDRQGTIVESRCSGWAVDRRIRQACAVRPESLFSNFTKGMVSGEAQHLRKGFDAGDRLAVEILNELGDDLAFGLSHVVHLFHPHVVVIGGGLSGVGEPLRSCVSQKLSGYIMDAFHPGPEIALAALREDAVPAGALVLAKGGIPALAASTAASGAGRK